MRIAGNVQGVDISVLIPTRNAGPAFAQVLESILGQDTSSTVEVLIVDSGSTDSTLEIAARYPVRVHRIRPEDFGHGRTRNLLAALARGELFVMLSQDASPADSSWLSRLCAPLHDLRVGATFGRQVARPDSSSLQRYFLDYWYPDLDDWRRLSIPTGAMTQSLFFSNVTAAYRKEVWERIHFDETLIMSEDQQWARQALAAGQELVYVSEAAVIHSHDYDLRSLFRRNFDSGASLANITSDKSSDWLRLGLRYVAGEVRYVRNRDGIRKVPATVLYEAVRFLGFFCGSHHRLIPLALKRRLSMHAYHWR